jgi:hypothetical protein
MYLSDLLKKLFAHLMEWYIQHIASLVKMLCCVWSRYELIVMLNHH